MTIFGLPQRITVRHRIHSEISALATDFIGIYGFEIRFCAAVIA